MESKKILVPYEERVPEIKYFHALMNMLGFQITYVHAELIYNMVERLQDKNGMFDIEDYAAIKYKWSEKWRKYQETQQKKHGK